LKAGQWKLIGRAKPKDLLKYSEADSVILHNNRDHVPASCFRMIPSYGWKSLQLIYNREVVFEQDEKNKAKWRANFVNSKGTALSLRVTDPATCERMGCGEELSKDCLLTVSMAAGWSPDKRTAKRCYKFVAGVIELDSSKHSA